jgi:ADP-heptose:LPS heptosyltransferase
VTESRRLEIPRLLVIHPGAIGDVLLALPALAHLARLFPGRPRVIAAGARPGALLRGSPYAEDVVGFDGLGLHRLFMAEPDAEVLWRLAGCAAMVSWFGANDAAYRASLAHVGCPTVLASATPPRGTRTHASRHLLGTLAALGPVPNEVPAVRLTPPDSERAWAEAWLRARGLGAGEAIVLHPGAGSPAKVWPELPALARRLRGAGRPVVAVTGPADATGLAQLLAGGVVAEANVARDLPLPRLLALLTVGRAFVGHDSGLTHLAAVAGCPTVALFGPTDPAIWSPVGGRVAVVAGQGAAGGDPWIGLTVDRVETALEALLTAEPAVVG